MATRKEIEDFILKYIYKLTSSKKNTELYTNLFKRLTDTEFKNFIEKRLKEDGEILPVIVPYDGNDTKTSVKNNMKILRELGGEPFQKLSIQIEKEMPRTITTEKYLILDLMYRRTKQTLAKGVSVAEHNRTYDQLTGQPTGESKTSKISWPEIQLLTSMGFKDSLVELMKIRGGDIDANRILMQSLIRYGKASQEMVLRYSKGTLSTNTLKAYFYSMGLKMKV